MYTENVFEDVKAKVLQEFNNVNVQDFDRFYEWLKPNLTIMEQLNKLTHIDYNSQTSEDVISSPDIIEEIKSPEEVNVDEAAKETFPIGHTLTFTKKAFGGVIEELDYPIPEEIVYKRGLENGNKLYISGTEGNFENGSPIYSFEVVDRTIIPNPTLAEINYGYVKNVGKRLVITETASGSIKDAQNDDQFICLYINEKDANRWKIKDGDVVNGRFYTNNVTNSFRVTHKINTHIKEQTESIEARRLNHRQNNQTESEAGLSMIDRLDTTPFLNKTIVLIGLRSRKKGFASILHNNKDINLIHLTGDENRARIRGDVLKADYVLLSTSENGHHTTNYVADICNEKNIPFTSTNSDGLFGVLMDVKALMNQYAA
ncbi:hypothetical protein ACFU1R_24620 [Priestia megaterium]|uniref:hypothetical protein n=1 Tax=Priestia megaterium TaxID=1404 RepID=UPI00366D30EE